MTSHEREISSTWNALWPLFHEGGGIIFINRWRIRISVLFLDSTRLLDTRKKSVFIGSPSWGPRENLPTGFVSHVWKTLARTWPTRAFNVRNSYFEHPVGLAGRFGGSIVHVKHDDLVGISKARSRARPGELASFLSRLKQLYFSLGFVRALYYLCSSSQMFSSIETKYQITFEARI